MRPAEMTGKEPVVLPTGRLVGRPARIDEDAIAEAVLESGLGRSSMKAVAEHLGVRARAVSPRTESEGTPASRCPTIHGPDALTES